MPETIVGRRQEIARVRELLAGSRLVTLTGPGGAGKSALASAVVDEASRIFTDGCWTVDLADLADPELVLPSVAGAAGVQLRSGTDAVDEIASVVGERRALLVLDGCDRVLLSAAETVRALLAGCPHLQVLATSRQPLRVTGEAVYDVGPLAFPDPAGAHSPTELTAYDAVTLFVRRAAAAVPTFRLTNDNASAVAGICAAVHGMPLGLELAATRVLVLSPQSILERLDDRYRLLTKGARDAPDRLRSLRASVDISYELCSPQEQLLWARVSTFAGGFTLDAVEAVCAGDGVEEFEILDLVDSLIERSVLLRDDTDPDRVRYRMLETIRAYGADKLDPADGDQRRRAHLAWHAALTERFAAEWFGADQVGWCRRLRCEIGNLQVALETALDSADTAPVALGIVTRLEPFWVVTGRVTEARRWLDRALAATSDAGARRIDALLLAAELAALQGALDIATPFLDEARTLAGPADDAALLRAQGWIELANGQLGVAAASLSEAAQSSRRAGDARGEAVAWLLAGVAHSRAGDPGAATEALRECLSLAEPLGEHQLRSAALVLLGVQALRHQDTAGAEHAGRESLRSTTALGDEVGTAFALSVLGCAAAADDAQGAALLIGIADRRWRALGLTAAAVPSLALVHQEAVRSLRDQLGATRFGAATRRGAELGAEAALRLAMEGVLDDSASPSGDVVDPGPLTARELEVAELVAKGLSNKDIAEVLVISPRTAQGHVENILRKLGLTSRTQVAAWVLERTTHPAGG